MKHAFTFTPSTSPFVDCESAAEQDAAFNRLAAGGQILMPLDSYGFSTRFGWCQDRFGVLAAQPAVSLRRLTKLPW